MERITKRIYSSRDVAPADIADDIDTLPSHLSAQPPWRRQPRGV
jgi:hypothetical protein